jgi:hypothetical protein
MFLSIKCLLSCSLHRIKQAQREQHALFSFHLQSHFRRERIVMAFFCTRSKAKDDDEVCRNRPLEERIAQSPSDNVELIGMHLTDRDVPIVVRRAIRKKKSSSLSLATNRITADGIRVLVDALESNRSLTHLILSMNPIGDDGVKWIGKLLAQTQTLYHLALSDTNITDSGLTTITDVLRTTNTSLRCLDLRSNTSITDASVDSLLSMVDRNQTLSACRLDNCSFTPDGKEKLREAKSVKW